MSVAWAELLQHQSQMTAATVTKDAVSLQRRSVFSTILWGEAGGFGPEPLGSSAVMPKGSEGFLLNYLRMSR